MGVEKKIIIEDISKSYKMYNSPMDRLKEAFSLSKRSYHTEFFALSNVSFDVDQGEIVGIMGRNGAGKSTLLKIITGILTPTYGKISVSGRISSLLELGAGFNMEYTGIDNIFFYGTLMGLTKEEITQKLNDIIDFAEIGDYIYQPVKTYSSGMFARLAFSCAINVDPEVLIVDEILSVGDIRFQAKCFNKFKQFKEKGITILYVGHDIATMRTFCDRCIWLNNGRIVDMGEPTYISAKYVEFMYLDTISDFTEYKIHKKEESGSFHLSESNTSQSVKYETDNVPETSTHNIMQRTQTGKPLAHWGRKVGLIKELEVTVDSKDLVSCSPFDEITISFTVQDDEDIDYDYFSAAFSIKNRDGMDLIVKTTYDNGIKFKKTFVGHHFQFKFQPLLTNGEYYLVVALEDRKNTIISYYEYIEGAKYFKIFEDKAFFGQFLPDIKIEVKGGINNE